MNNKLEWLESIRGGAILLVVLGHLTLINGVGAYSEIIYLFHMPLFFAISGFLYGYKELNNVEKPQCLIEKKLISLGIPYVVFSVIYVCFNVVMQRFVQINTVTKIKSLVTLLWNPVAQYWFIWVLLIYFIVVSYFGNTYSKVKVLMILGLAVSLLENVIMKNLGTAYHNGLAYFFYFVFAAMIGYNFRKGKSKEICANIGTVIVLLITGVFFVLFACQKTFLETSLLRATLLRMLGIVAFSASVICVTRVVIIKEALMTIGKYSWYIFLLHSYFLCFTRVILKKIIPLGNPEIEVVVGMTVSVGGCMLIGYISKKKWWIDGFFYPQHLVKRRIRQDEQ